MKTLSRTLIPADFSYYRTGSRVFYEYYKKCTWLLVERIGKWYDFLLGFQAFPWFWSISLEKHDMEITRSYLNSLGIRHALVFWTPLSLDEKPAGWWRVPVWYTKRNIHSSRSAFAVLDGPEYYKKWSASARGHRRHVLSNIEVGKIRIERESNLEVFLNLYKKTQVHDSEK